MSQPNEPILPEMPPGGPTEIPQPPGPDIQPEPVQPEMPPEPRVPDIGPPGPDTVPIPGPDVVPPPASDRSVADTDTRLSVGMGTGPLDTGWVRSEVRAPNEGRPCLLAPHDLRPHHDTASERKPA